MGDRAGGGGCGRRCDACVLLNGVAAAGASKGTTHRLLVDLARPAEAVGRDVVHAVDAPPAAREGEALHVAALGAAQRQDALLRCRRRNRRTRKKAGGGRWRQRERGADGGGARCWWWWPHATPRLGSPSMSREMGSMPFWLMITKLALLSGVHTARLSSMILRTLSSTNLRSASTSLSRSAAVE